MLENAIGVSADVDVYDVLSYLQDEVSWVRARVVRLGLERTELDEDRVAKALSREHRLRRRIDQKLARTRSEGILLPLDQLCETYNLTENERRLLLLAVAPCISRDFGALFSRLDPGAGEDLNVGMAFTFCGIGARNIMRGRAMFQKNAPLMANQLITLNIDHCFRSPKDLFDAYIDLTAPTFQYLVGEDGLIEEFGEFSSIEAPLVNFDDVVLPDAVRSQLETLIQPERCGRWHTEWGLDQVIPYGRGVMVLFYGPPGTGKTTTAHGIAQAMGCRILKVDIPTLLNHKEAGRFLPGLFREAHLQNCILLFDECDMLLADRMQGNQILSQLLGELERFEGLAILTTNLPDIIDPAVERRLLLRIPFGRPNAADREKIWRQLLPPTVPVAADVDIPQLAHRYRFSGGYIKNAVLLAAAAAIHDNPQAPCLTRAHLEAASESQLARMTSGDDGAAPERAADDIVLAGPTRAAMDALLSVEENRRADDAGQCALIVGASGTGKTLCAEVIASALRRRMLTVSVPELLLSGDAVGNLKAAFDTAARNNGVLVIDGFSTDANITGSMESLLLRVARPLIARQPGLVLLASEVPLDEARAGTVLTLSAPDRAQRAEIWRRMVPASVDTRSLARLPMTGGDIREAARVAAMQSAGSTSAELLMRVARRRAGEETATTIGFRRR